MRVICIYDNDQDGDDIPSVIKGNIYTVINSKYIPQEEDEHYEYDAGIYYTLIEMGGENCYHSSMFLPINENQQDETEFTRNYNKELA